MLLKAYDKGNSENTIDYLQYLITESPEQQLLLFWDGATYHRSKEIQGFLDEVNQGLTIDQWKIRCVRFAPNCPEQNPIEDIWLQAKTWVRRFCALIPTFSHLKWMFEWFIRHTIFDFPTLNKHSNQQQIHNVSKHGCPGKYRWDNQRYSHNAQLATVKLEMPSQ